MLSEGNLATRGLPADTVGLLEGITTTRAIRRYTDEPVPTEALRAMLFAATRGPSGSNRQPFRFVVLEDSDTARQAKALVASSARRMWALKELHDGYQRGSALDASSPKARMARAMTAYVDKFERVPVLIFPCLVRFTPPGSAEGAAIYPACQNLLLAARALGFGGVMTAFHLPAEPELRVLLGIPETVFLAATITIGRPAGHHGHVRRRPLRELVFSDHWDEPAAWAVDPPGTRFAAAGPPPAPLPPGTKPQEGATPEPPDP